MKMRFYKADLSVNAPADKQIFADFRFNNLRHLRIALSLCQPDTCERKGGNADPRDIHGHRRKRVIIKRIDGQRDAADKIHDLIRSCIPCQLFRRDEKISQKIEEGADPAEAVNDDFFQVVLLI